MSGGETYISGPVNDGNSALDYNGEAVISGGTFVAAGSSGMAQNFGSSSTQGTVLVSVGSQEAGSVVSLQDSDGTELMQWEPDKVYTLSLIHILENQTLRISTGVLNEIMMEAVAMQQPPSDKGKRLKLYYITQVAVKPPTFVIFVNDKELMHFSYTRYLENKIREAFGFKGTSLKFFIRERKEKDR